MGVIPRTDTDEYLLEPIYVLKYSSAMISVLMCVKDAVAGCPDLSFRTGAFILPAADTVVY